MGLLSIKCNNNILILQKKMKFKHICKGCSYEFYGRRNQEFHNLQCKIDYNNEKAAQLRKELKDNKISIKNHLIFRDAYSNYKNRAILLVDLLKKGLELKAPTRKWKTPKNGYEVYLSNGYAFRITTENGNQFISIFKEEEITNL